MISEIESKSVGEPEGLDSIWRLNETVSIHEVGESQFAVRDLLTKAYFRVGVKEAFLLGELRQGVSYHQLKDRFFAKFGDSLEFDDFDDFLKTLAGRQLLKEARHHPISADRIQRLAKADDDEEEPVNSNGRGGSLLYYRLPLVNPNRFLNWFVNAFPVFWTKSFLVATVCMMLFSLSITGLGH